MIIFVFLLTYHTNSLGSNKFHEFMTHYEENLSEVYWAKNWKIAFERDIMFENLFLSHNLEEQLKLLMCLGWICSNQFQSFGLLCLSSSRMFLFLSSLLMSLLSSIQSGYHTDLYWPIVIIVKDFCRLWIFGNFAKLNVLQNENI